MRFFQGRIQEIVLEATGEASARIACPSAAVPAAGQYLMAHAPFQSEVVLGNPLFSMRSLPGGFQCVPPVPESWQPGTLLSMRGPLGKGFQIPKGIGRLAVAALGDTFARLLPVAFETSQAGGAVASFFNGPLPVLPAAIEVYPVTDLPGVLGWADFLVLDLPLGDLASLRALLNMDEINGIPCPGQALLSSPMPCGGLADCGVCAIPTRKTWKLACKVGPVFNLNELNL